MDGTEIFTQEEQRLFEAAKTEEQQAVTQDGVHRETTVDPLQAVREKYQSEGKKLYTIKADLSEDDDTEIHTEFLFQRPSSGSYDRYIKTMSASMSKSSKAFVLDNIIEEQRGELRKTLEDYPALAISVANKLLAMLGLADSVSVKKV